MSPRRKTSSARFCVRSHFTNSTLLRSGSSRSVRARPVIAYGYSPPGKRRMRSVPRPRLVLRHALALPALRGLIACLRRGRGPPERLFDERQHLRPPRLAAAHGESAVAVLVVRGVAPRRVDLPLPGEARARQLLLQ